MCVKKKCKRLGGADVMGRGYRYAKELWTRQNPYRPTLYRQTVDEVRALTVFVDTQYNDRGIGGGHMHINKTKRGFSDYHAIVPRLYMTGNS